MEAQAIPAKGKPKASRPVRKPAPNSERGKRVREILARLRDRLALDDKELGQMLGTGEATVRRWAQGVDVAPISFVASLTPHSASLARLEEILVPDRMAEAIRRPAPLFDGRSALDWILEGRFPEVVDRYEIAVRYQA
jgi:hypothetical protein